MLIDLLRWNFRVSQVSTVVLVSRRYLLAVTELVIISGLLDIHGRDDLGVLVMVFHVFIFQTQPRILHISPMFSIKLRLRILAHPIR